MYSICVLTVYVLVCGVVVEGEVEMAGVDESYTADLAGPLPQEKVRSSVP